MNNKNYDAVVIGGGFGGLYSVHRLRNILGLNVIAYEKGSDVGGTWYWNRYPGALSDTESYVYQYSFDRELYMENDQWTHTFLTQPQIKNYLGNVADRYDLRRSYEFKTTVTKAHFKEDTGVWEVTTDKGDVVTAKYLITGLGLLSASNIPNFKGIDTFEGKKYHTAHWPEDADLKGKRVGVIGTGSTGVQVVTAIAEDVAHLNVFQRTPQYSVPLGYRPQSEEEIQDIKNRFDEVWDYTKNSQTAQGCEEGNLATSEVSDEEREKIFEWAWNKGGGFRFLFSFNDIAVDEKANQYAADFIKKKIKEIVKDPETAEKLTPSGYYAKRPLADNGYYETFNRDNVSLVDVKADPIVEITPKGIRTENNEYELDVIIFATGFDAIEGNYTRIDLRGRNGMSINEKWADGPKGYLATTNSDFPNMFMVLGPNGPFTNLATASEVQVEWISDTIKYMVDNDYKTIEPTEEMEDEWVKVCKDISDATLFSKVDSWIFGANIPGKKHAIRFYMGGMGTYRKELEKRGYNGFIFDKELAMK